MKAQRLNLIVPVRNALWNAGVSTVRVVNAVNAALGELKPKTEEHNLGDGKVSKTAYKVTETTATKYEGAKTNVALLFDAWHSAVGKANKIASFETVAIPGIFDAWIAKFKTATEAKELEEEKKNTVKTEA